jgi:hypothetical protein
MKIKFPNVLFVFLLSVISPCGFILVNAQDANFPGTEVEDLGTDKEREKIMYTPGELDPSLRKSPATAYKDSLAMKSTVRSTKSQTPDSSKPPVKQPSQEDDSILSFNFLYYIFQKYKLQDIVD